jgi:hypothetical protein
MSNDKNVERKNIERVKMSKKLDVVNRQYIIDLNELLDGLALTVAKQCK